MPHHFAIAAASFKHSFDYINGPCNPGFLTHCQWCRLASRLSFFQALSRCLQYQLTTKFILFHADSLSPVSLTLRIHTSQVELTHNSNSQLPTITTIMSESPRRAVAQSEPIASSTRTSNEHRRTGSMHHHMATSPTEILSPRSSITAAAAAGPAYPHTT